MGDLHGRDMFLLRPLQEALPAVAQLLPHAREDIEHVVGQGVVSGIVGLKQT